MVILKVKDVISSLRKTILFNPIWLLGKVLERNMREVISSCNIKTSEKWLDLGCGTRPYEQLFPEGVYIGVDVEESGRGINLKSPDHFYDGKTLPFPDNSFDGILSTQVLEHVPEPQLYLLEAARVLKPGGKLILSAPFMYEEHEKPFDFFRFSQFGLTELLAKANLEVNKIIKDSGAILTIAMLTNIYVSTSIVPEIKGASVIFSLFLCFPIQVISIALSKILPDHHNLYMNLIVKATLMK
jgi:SAM-dependent methyltransferase